MKFSIFLLAGASTASAGFWHHFCAKGFGCFGADDEPATISLQTPAYTTPTAFAILTAATASTIPTISTTLVTVVKITTSEELAESSTTTAVDIPLQTGTAALGASGSVTDSGATEETETPQSLKYKFVWNTLGRTRFDYRTKTPRPTDV
ncbi:hypothetical protein BROUX41_006009 [Berkeleyomyces rouxiae]|uniref:uncharacterized protein n=1 Tax=Berkeleyomyces rouxiae TaxID=2035830 RepID=UPI003B7DAF85